MVKEEGRVQSRGAVIRITELEEGVGYMLYSLHVRMEGRCACQRCSSTIPKEPSTETVVRPFSMQAQGEFFLAIYRFYGYL